MLGPPAQADNFCCWASNLSFLFARCTSCLMTFSCKHKQNLEALLGEPENGIVIPDQMDSSPPKKVKNLKKVNLAMKKKNRMEPHKTGF